MRLNGNLILTGGAQLYNAALNVLCVPLYVKLLGAERYGLVGVFGLMQACFGILDLGLGSTLAREVARYIAGASSAREIVKVYQVICRIGLVVAAVGATLIVVFSNVIARKWLSATSISFEEIRTSLQLMGGAACFRWSSGIYRGVLSGGERFVVLAASDMAFATVRFLGVLVTLDLIGHDSNVFFGHQLGVAMLECTILYWCGRQRLPFAVARTQPPGVFNVRSVIQFALTVSLSTIAWVVITQSDKVLLSGMLKLEDYGYYSMAVLVAGSVTIVNSPIVTITLPRLARLHASGDDKTMLTAYRGAVKLVSLIAMSVAVTLAFSGKEVVFAWTGDVQVASRVAPIMQWYAMGNGLLAFGAFPYYLQYAMGDMKYHVKGSIVLIFALIPGIAFGASQHGALGAGVAWCIINALYVVLWVAYVHRRLVPGLHYCWMKDIITTVVPSICSAAVIASVLPRGLERSTAAVNASLIGATCVFVAWVSAYKAPAYLKWYARVNG